MIAQKNKNEWGQTGWMIIDNHNFAIAGYNPAYSLSLEEAENFIYNE